MTDFTRRAFLGGLAVLVGTQAHASETPIIFAAASLKPALDRIFAERDVSLSYAGSGLLARQIKLGAPADVFLSAAPSWMNEVDQHLVAGTRRDLLSNRLVLVGPEGGSLHRIPADARLVTGLVDAVPLGVYAKAALLSLDLWDDLSDRIIQVDNARIATTLVARGEVPYGLIYDSDARAAPDLTTLERLPEDLHPPIRYPIGLLTERGRGAYDQLLSDQARAIFRELGFGVL